MRSSAKRLWSDQSGAIAAIYAIALPALIAAGGIAFDYARLAAMDTELQNAADQAALAAATQLDGKSGAVLRATNASGLNAGAEAPIPGLVANNTLFANDGGGRGVNIAAVTFYEDREGEDEVDPSDADADSRARFVEVRVGAREAVYALTPVVGAFRSGDIDAAAMAGLSSSVCKVPPIMICSPDPSIPFDADAREGQGLVATGHSPGANGNKGGDPGSGSTTKWSPGNFGFLQVNDTDEKKRNAALLKALAYADPEIDCIKIEDNEVSTGNPQGLYDAINTRFGIYDFNSSGNGNVLASCEGGDCPPAPNVRADHVQTGKSCKIAKNGFELPAKGSEFKPVNPGGSYVATQTLHSNATLAAMGLPRDNCHYTSFNGTGFCSGSTGRFGSGEWARADYFNKYHPIIKPAGWESISRYQTYLWELAENMPTGGAPVCGPSAGEAIRRVLTVAVVTNCDELSGASQPVEIDQWVDVFLVEPTSDDDRRWNAFKDSIYMEIIGESRVVGSGVYDSQGVRRDVPFLVR